MPGYDEESQQRWPRGDHDLLIGLRAEMKALREDVQDIKDVLRTRDGRADGVYAGFEARIRTLENWRWYVIGITCAAIALLGIILKLTSH